MRRTSILLAAGFTLAISPALAQSADGSNRSDHYDRSERTSQHEERGGDRDDRGSFERDRRAGYDDRGHHMGADDRAHHAGYDDRGHHMGYDDRGRGDEDNAPMHRSGRGTSFFLQTGNARLAVRCGDEQLKTCVDAAMALMDKAKSGPAPSGAAAPTEKQP